MIEIKNLDFYYNKKHTVLENISMRLSEGRIFGLLGKNGVGKSTLLQLMAGLQFPVNGSITVDDCKPQARQVKLLQDMFLLSEEVPDTSMTISQFENINARFYPKFSHEEFVSSLNEFEIADFSQKIDKLSFGTRKKVFIAFALACNTKYLFMDEPTNGLDIPSKTSFRKLLRMAVKENSLAIISTHQARDLQNILDAIIILDETHLLLNATDDEICEKLYFGAQTEDDNEQDILYSEPSVAGNVVVKLNKQHQESNLDVELLFNAAFNSKDMFKKAFNV